MTRRRRRRTRRRTRNDLEEEYNRTCCYLNLMLFRYKRKSTLHLNFNILLKEYRYFLRVLQAFFGSEGHNYVQIRLLIQKNIKSLYVQHNTILMPELTKTFCNFFSTESFGLEIEHNMLAFCESVCWELREVWQKLNNKLLRIMWDLACWLHTS